MSHIVRKTRAGYREIRPGPEGPRLLFHITLSFLAATILSLAVELSASKDLIISNINAFNGFIRTMFALLFTVLAIIIAFEEQFSENTAIQELKRAGYYSNIFRRFYLSVAAVGIILLYSIIGTIFGIYQLDRYISNSIIIPFRINIIESLSVFLIIFGLSVAILRVISCFFIYFRIERIIRRVED